MKKILLATTILGMSAGIAAADISWSASAGAGIASDFGGDYQSYSFMKLGVKGSGETDSGLTFSASTDLTTGVRFKTGGDLGDGFDYFQNTHNFGDEDAIFGTPTIAIGGSFGTISFSTDNIDFYDDAHGSGDVKYEGTFGPVTAGVVLDFYDYLGGTEGEYSVKLAYSANNIAISVDSDSYDVYNASAGYTFGSITATLSTDESEAIYAKVAYDANGISASLKVGDDDTWEAKAGYTANGLTVEAKADDSNYTRVTGSYDLGGGLSVVAGADSDESAYVGAAMKF